MLRRCSSGFQRFATYLFHFRSNRNSEEPPVHESELEGETKGLEMGRGVSSGGGQSSLGYLFGSGEPANDVQASQKPNGSSQPISSTTSQPTDDKQIPAGIPGNLTNNYYRADGQNCGNFITDRPSTKVHAAPGGGSSLDFLFGNGRS